MEHTPAPWEVMGATIIVSPCTCYICEVYDPIPEGKQELDINSPRWEEGVANAKLIAAAPDLLEALTEALDFIERFGGQRHLSVTGCQCAHCIIIESAKTAIAKATE